MSISNTLLKKNLKEDIISPNFILNTKYGIFWRVWFVGVGILKVLI